MKPGEIAVSELAPGPFCDAVKNGRLCGKVVHQRWNGADYPYPILTDSPDRMLKFIENSKPEVIFDTPLRLYRIGGP